MPSFFRSAAALALAGSAIATPWNKRFTDDSCLAAVTGKAALGDDSLRKEHCTSFFKTIVTPAAVTVTTTITDAPKPSDWNQWEKKDVTVCPNEVPNYASACDDKGYRSACKAWGVISETTFTIPATTTTKTVYFGNGKDGVCQVATVTKTEAGSTSTVAASTTTVAGSTTTTSITVTLSATTVTAAEKTVTVTAGEGSAHPTGGVGAPFPNGTTEFPGCLTTAKAKEFTDAFKNLLEFTNAGVPGVSAPYNSNISAKYLDDNFQDYSDSINWMSGRPLGSVTFKSRAEFDSEQGNGQQPITIIDQMTTVGCKSITWRWTAMTSTGGQVTGINNMLINDDLTKMIANYAEFNSAAWIQSLTNIPLDAFKSINCKVPDLSGGASNTTAPQVTSTITATLSVTPTPTTTTAP